MGVAINVTDSESHRVFCATLLTIDTDVSVCPLMVRSDPLSPLVNATFDKTIRMRYPVPVTVPAGNEMGMVPVVASVVAAPMVTGAEKLPDALLNSTEMMLPGSSWFVVAS